MNWRYHKKEKKDQRIIQKRKRRISLICADNTLKTPLNDFKKIYKILHCFLNIKIRKEIRALVKVDLNETEIKSILVQYM